VQKDVAEQLGVDTASMGNRGKSPQDDRFAPKNLVKARQRLGLSQTAFAKRLGINWRSVATGNRVVVPETGGKRDSEKRVLIDNEPLRIRAVHWNT